MGTPCNRELPKILFHGTKWEKKCTVSHMGLKRSSGNSQVSFAGVRGYGPSTSQDPSGTMSEKRGGVPIKIPFMTEGKLRFWADSSGRVQRCNLVDGELT